tara:strand:+ start:393 stop:551 length:159 start_codon:yes stop_codon:yes gene_type:complete
MTKIRFKLKQIDKELGWTKNNGFFTIPLGMPVKTDLSKQSTFKEWNKKWKKK